MTAMKTQHSQKLQINKYHLKDNNNKINHHSRERDLFLSPLEMFAFCVTEKASGSCPGVSFSWFWTQELHVCLLSGLCATGMFSFLAGCGSTPDETCQVVMCVLRDWAHRSRPLGTCVCSRAELKPEWLSRCLAVCP